MTGAEMIAAERKRQVEVKGWSAAHDAEHDGGELLGAASAYAFTATCQLRGEVHGQEDRVPNDWPWDDGWWKPSMSPTRNLVKAGALIAAEIDRIEARIDRMVEDAAMPSKGE